MTNTVLDLAISLIFVYLLVSALCSALQELLANARHWRAATLEQALGKLLQDTTLAQKIYEHPLLKGMWTPPWVLNKNAQKPSYIPSDTLARVLLDLHGNNILTGTAKDIVDKLAPAAVLDFDKRRASIEKWFDDAMERVSGWYKRKAHAWLWAIAFAVCAVLNVDSFMLGRIFWNDDALRQSVVAAATKYVEGTGKQSSQPGMGVGPADQKEKEPGIGKAAGTGSQTSATGQSGSLEDAKNTETKQAVSKTADKTAQSDDEIFARLKTVQSQLADTGLPLGWCWTEANGALKCWPTLRSAKAKDSQPENSTSAQEQADKNVDPRMRPQEWGWLVKLFGILISALAVSQGSPFWFDLLQKVVNLRLTGQKPGTKKK